MYLRPRHRRGQYPLVQERALPGWARLLLMLGAALLALYLVWTLLLRVLGIGNTLVRAGAALAVEERGTVSVMIEGQEQRAENGMMLFSGEQVATGPGAHASLQFYDGTRVRLDDSTALNITESERGESESHLILQLDSGTLWISTPSAATFSGSIVRRILTPTLRFDIPSGTEATLSPTSLVVFSADGNGVSVTHGQAGTFTISEGQQWAMPKNGSIGSDVYAHRTALDPLVVQSSFVRDSRVLMSSKRTPSSASASNQSSELLTVSEPATGAIVQDAVITVRGTVGAGVSQVLINGYPAIIDLQKATFSQQVSPPDGTGDFELRIQALDSAKNVLADVRRSVKRAPVAPLSAPTVTSPAKTGETYRTMQEELILRGGAPAGAAGILVNDYKLQLFDPAKGEWSYVASLRLGNMKPGSNVYDVYAVDGAGRKSPSARITILQGEGPEGVIGSVSSTAAVSSTGPLPSNAPLLPGSLQVIAPTAGTLHAETGTGFLLEGTTSAQTASVSVNDYTLQLYRAGKTTWNYIVDVSYNNMRKGKNTYVVVARNSKGEILDTMTYTVEYTPR